MPEPDLAGTKPFLLLSIRAEPEAAEDEYAAFLRATGLGPTELPRLDVHGSDLPEVDLDAWAGIVLGGGPWNVSDPDHLKSPAQRRAEAWLARLLDVVVARDVPFLGACYGIGTLGRQQGGVVGRDHPEGVGPLQVTLTEEGLTDPLLAGLPREFAAYGGHKESLSVLPPGAVRLATSPACPVQAFRVREHAYATQFHPELDVAGICTRIEVYRDAGYFEPDQAETLAELSRSVLVEHPTRILRRFVELFAR